MKDFFKSLFAILLTSSAFFVGLYIGQEKIKSKFPDFQEDQEDVEEKDWKPLSLFGHLSLSLIFRLYQTDTNGFSHHGNGECFRKDEKFRDRASNLATHDLFIQKYIAEQALAEVKAYIATREGK